MRRRRRFEHAQIPSIEERKREWEKEGVRERGSERKRELEKEGVRERGS